MSISPDILTSIEPSGTDVLRRLLQVSKKLLLQGEGLQQIYSGAKMLVFVGRQADKIVDIQAQYGTNTRQLIIAVMGKEEAMMLKINHQHEKFFQEDIEQFSRANMNPNLRAKVEESFPRNVNLINYNLPTISGDLPIFVEILESTEIDPGLLRQAVKFDVASGQYQEVGLADKLVEAQTFWQLSG